LRQHNAAARVGTKVERIILNIKTISPKSSSIMSNKLYIDILCVVCVFRSIEDSDGSGVDHKKIFHIEQDATLRGVTRSYLNTLRKNQILKILPKPKAVVW
jgi:hypothetical protein